MGRAQAGVFALGSDHSRDTSVIRTRVRGFRSHGILFAQREYGRPAAALHGLALDNVVSDIRDPARDSLLLRAELDAEVRDERGRHLDRRCRSRDHRQHGRGRTWDGIETVGSSTRTGRREHDPRDPYGHLPRALDERLALLAELVTGPRTGINVEWWHDGQGSTRNTFSSNRIVSASKGGLFVDVGDDGNQIVENVFVGGGAAGDRAAGHVGQRRAAEPGLPRPATRSSFASNPRTTTTASGRAQAEPAEREHNPHFLPSSLTEPTKPEAVARSVGSSCLRVGEPLLGEDRRQRRLLRRGADRRARARPAGRGTVAFITVTALVVAHVAGLGVGEATTVLAAQGAATPPPSPGQRAGLLPGQQPRRGGPRRSRGCSPAT